MATSLQSNSSTLQSSGLVVSRTWLNQTRVTAQKNGVSGFQVTTVATIPGLLPDVSIFLMQIQDREDSSQDTFLSVIHPADFDAYPSLRANAISSGSTYYRTASVTQFYTDILTARISALNLQDQADTLTRDWISYYYDFAYGPPGDFLKYPSTDKAIYASLVANWQAAQAGTATAQTALAAATADIALTKAASDAATQAYDNTVTLKTIIDDAKAQSDALEQILSYLGDACAVIGEEPIPLPGAVDSGSGLWLRVNNLLATIKAQVALYPDQPGLIAIQNEAGGKSYLWGGVADLERAQTLVCSQSLVTGRAAFSPLNVAEASVLLTQATAAKTTAEANYKAAVTAQTTAQANYDSAVLAEANALAAIKQVCAGFDPANPTALLVG